MRSSPALVLPALAAAACCSPRFSPLEHDLIAIAAEQVGAVSAVMGEPTGPRRVEIHLAAYPLESGHIAGTTGTRAEIVFGSDVGALGRTARTYYVVHELVHFHAQREWELLPDPVEEGLAELVATTLVPEGREHVERRFRDGDAREAEGWRIARRLGVDGLRALALRARVQGLEEVPMEWFEPQGPSD